MSTPPAAFRLSALDLSPIPAGFSAGDALRSTLDLARYAESLGLARYWLAEHHNAAGLASSAPEIMIGQVAAATQSMRVGAGGMMLPNHSPLKVAELFRVLHALFPGRIDLGIGRAAGTDPRTALALRGGSQSADDFGSKLGELVDYLSEHDGPRPAFSRSIAAIPAGVASPDLFVLGSSEESAIAAAKRGLGFAYGHHLSPNDAALALRSYREHFRPSEQRDRPEAILALAVVCAATDEEAERLASSGDLAMLRFGQGIRDLPIPPPEEALAYAYDEDEETFRALNRSRVVVGGIDRVRSRIAELAQASGADEVMMVCSVHDHAARRDAYRLVAGAFGVRPR